MKSDVFSLKVHPAAEIFPMLDDAELTELAADIQANGLLHPLVVKDGVLIDGRNRRAACRLAGVTPAVEELNGTDPVAYILATNINRRHLTKGQRAMAVAKLYPEPEKGGRGKKAGKIPEFLDSGSLSHARTVLAVLPQAADAVLAGTSSLTDAYADALKVKTDRESDVQRLARLRERAADLADLVSEGRMTLTEAQSAYETRQEDLRRRRFMTRELFDGLDRMLDVLAEGKRRDAVVADLQSHPDEQQHARTLLEQWIANLRATLEAL